MLEIKRGIRRFISGATMFALAMGYTTQTDANNSTKNRITPRIAMSLLKDEYTNVLHDAIKLLSKGVCYKDVIGVYMYVNDHGEFYIICDKPDTYETIAGNNIWPAANKGVPSGVFVRYSKRMSKFYAHMQLGNIDEHNKKDALKLSIKMYKLLLKSINIWHKVETREKALEDKYAMDYILDALRYNLSVAIFLRNRRDVIGSNCTIFTPHRASAVATVIGGMDIGFTLSQVGPSLRIGKNHKTAMFCTAPEHKDDKTKK